MKRIKLVAAVAAGAAFPLVAAVPNVSGVAMSQGTGSREVTITYNLDDAAVVTLDVQTNANTSAAANDPGWTSIGGEAVANAYGDVWKKVNDAGSSSFSGTIKWRPDDSWPDHVIESAGARAVVTAWATNNTPDFMVVHLDVANAAPNYYPAKEYLPGATPGQKGAITNNPAYKTTKLLMRKIVARGVQWTMGSTENETTCSNASGSGDDRQRETTHCVTLTNNYYIGVFEITQKQLKMVAPDSTLTPYFSVDGDMRPMESICFNEIRNNSLGSTAEDPTYRWPEPPNPASFLGLLRAKANNMDFDLPSEAQWEFVCRAGNGDGLWNNGLPITQKFTNRGTNYTDSNLALLARYYGQTHSTSTPNPAPAPDVGGTAIVGSYLPNSWDIYDMHGNVLEHCLDTFKMDISADGGAVYEGKGGQHRGGGYKSDARRCRAARRDGVCGSNTRVDNVGLRVVCTDGLN